MTNTEIEFKGIIARETREKLAEYIENHFDEGDYLVVDDPTRDQEVKDYIRESVWAFKPSFILDHIDLPHYVNLERVEESLGQMQAKLCEDANELILAMIKDFDDFVDNAVTADGYGAFLAPYDHDEHEIYMDGKFFFAYRIN